MTRGQSLRLAVSLLVLTGSVAVTGLWSGSDDGGVAVACTVVDSFPAPGAFAQSTLNFTGHVASRAGLVALVSKSADVGWTTSHSGTLPRAQCQPHVAVPIRSTVRT